MAAAKIAQRQIVATINKATTSAPEWGGFKFPQVSGGEITASVEKIYEGGKAFPSLLCAPAEIGDITLTAHYDDSGDDGLTSTADNIAAKLGVLRQMVGRCYYNINIAVYDCDIKVQGADRQYNNALLVGITEPDGDSSSGAPATFSMTFAVQDVSSPSQPTNG